jgi:hypothetical protein
MCSVGFLEQTVINSLYSINQFILVIPTCYVFFEVVTEFLIEGVAEFG